MLVQIMHLVGFKGFSRFGTIQPHFTSGFFPYRWNWTTKHARELPLTITQYIYDHVYPDVPQSFDYIAVCYSDGGTVAHILPYFDFCCRGVIAVNASFPKEAERLYAKTGRTFPVLLIQNNNDLTQYLPWRSTRHAINFYQNIGTPLEVHSLPGKAWHGHDFNGLSIMQSWCLRNFNYDLPIRKDQ